MNDQEPQTDSYSHPKLITALKFFSGFTGYFLIFAGCVALAAWNFNWAFLKTALDPLMALAFLFAAVSLIFLMPENQNRLPSLSISKVSLFFVFFFALIRIFSIFLSSSQMHLIIFEGNSASRAMELHTTMNFIGIGFALYAIDWETTQKIRPAQVLSLMVIASSLFAVLGYLYNVQIFYGGSSLALKALITPIFFILLSSAVLCIRPTEGVLGMITSKSMGGTLSRRLLPACVFVPALVGLLALCGQNWGLYNKEFLLVIVVISNILVFTALVWWLSHILFAIDVKRKKAEDAIRHSSLTDELTGLYNRRGFRLLAEQQLKIAKRSNQSCLMFFADLDGLKRINDTFGHKEGDQALINVAIILKNTFRDVDIVARFAGDEFAVLCASGTIESSKLLVERLESELALFNTKNPWLPYHLSFSVGTGFLEGKNATIDELMLEADKKLYEIKAAKKK